MKQIACKYCGHPGCVVLIDDMYYARCTRCKKWSPFEFLAVKEELAIKNWNLYNDKCLPIQTRKQCKSN